MFIEIIQRVGCMKRADDGKAAGAATAPPEPATSVAATGPANEPQAAGCGGFGKGNFSELFKRIEDYERTLTV